MKKSKLFQSALSLMLVGGMLTACGSSASSTAASTAASTGSDSAAASTASDSAAPAATKQYVIGIAEAQRFMPFQTNLLPFLEPIQFRSRFYKELHLHLFELTHTEDELTGYNLVTESFTDLSDTERNFHAAGLLYVQIIDKDTLCRLRTKIDFHRTIGSRTHIGREHQIELTNFCPILSTGNRASYFFVNNDLTELFQIVIVQRFCETFVQCITLCLMLKNTPIGAAELSFVESFTKSFGSFGHLFINLIIVLSQLIFNQHIGTVAFFRVFIINQRIVKCIHMSGSLPDGRVHKDCRVNTDNVFVQQHHAVPPVFFNIVFQFNTHLSVVIHRAQSVVDIA